MALAMASTGSRERKGRGFFDSLREREEDSVICGREDVGFRKLVDDAVYWVCWPDRYGREGRQRHGPRLYGLVSVPAQYAGGSYISKINDATNACGDWPELACQALLQVSLYVCSCR